jgi:uncharacterized protein (DUF488 family)
MFSRQRVILRLLQNEGGSTSRLRLVKLAFMVSRERDVPRTGIYEFVPYRRGPFSFTLYHDLRGLANDGWVAEAERDIGLTQAADLETAFLDSEFVDRIDRVSQRFRGMATSALVDRVYRDHPWFTINSEATEKRAIDRPKSSRAVYTVGYEGIMVDGLLDLLLRTGVERLIDVRCNPIARRYGFHKSTLNRLSADVGIEYTHVPSLGIPSAWRENLGDRESYDRLFLRYELEILPAETASVLRVGRLINERPSALMCMEADHTCCHRSRLAVLVSQNTALPIKELR